MTRRLAGLRLLAPLHARGFRRLWAGQAASMLGDGAFIVAITVLTASLSRGAPALAAVWLAWSLAVVACSLVAGVAADRLDRRRVLIAADAVRMVAVATLALLASVGAVELWHCVAVAAVVGAGEAFAHPALTALVPALVDGERLAQANALSQLLRPLCFRAIGPAIGGALCGLSGAPLALAFDAATVGVAVVCAAAVTAPARVARAPAAALHELRAGLRYVRSERWLWIALAAAGVSLLCFWGPVEVLLPVVVLERYGDGPAAFGFILAASGVAAVVAAIVVGQRGLPADPLRAAFLWWGTGALAIAGYGVAASSWQAAGFAVVYGAAMSAGSVAWATLLQQRVPDALLGRVASIDFIVSLGLTPVSLALVAPVAVLAGSQATLIGAGIGGAAAIAAALAAVSWRARPARAPVAVAHSQDGGARVASGA